MASQPVSIWLCGARPAVCLYFGWLSLECVFEADLADNELTGRSTGAVAELCVHERKRRGLALMQALKKGSRQIPVWVGVPLQAGEWNFAPRACVRK